MPASKKKWPSAPNLRSPLLVVLGWALLAACTSSSGNNDVFPAAEDRTPGIDIDSRVNVAETRRTDDSPEILCAPVCEATSCGADGCGGTCGGCAAGMGCSDGVCVPLSSECNDGNDQEFDGCGQGNFTETGPISCLGGGIRYPAAIGLPDGTAVIAMSSAKPHCMVPENGWQGPHPCCNEYGSFSVFAVRTDSLGTQTGGFSDILVSAHDELQFDRVTPVPIGTDKALLVWESDQWSVCGGESLLGFNPSLYPADGPPKWVLGLGTRPVSTGTNAGEGIVLWNQEGSIGIRSFSSSGLVQGEYSVVAPGLEGRTPIDVTTCDSGEHAVIWTALNVGVGASVGRLALLGSELSSTQPGYYLIGATPSEQTRYALARVDGNSVVAVQAGPDAVMAQCLDDCGRAPGEWFELSDPPVQVDLDWIWSLVDVTGLSNGTFAATWVTRDETESLVVVAGVYRCDGTIIRSAIPVRSRPLGLEISPTIAALSDGFVVAWQRCFSSSVHSDGTNIEFDENCGVFSQAFNLLGQKTWRTCNDGICNGDEDCSSCPKDCGTCTER